VQNSFIEAFAIILAITVPAVICFSNSVPKLQSEGQMTPSVTPSEDDPGIGPKRFAFSRNTELTN